jgi:hypothetical protein
MAIMATFMIGIFIVASVPIAAANSNDMATCTDQHKYSVKCFPFILPFP